MPLTALRTDGSVLDSTEIRDEVWQEVHRNPEARKALSCRECRAPMHAKVSSKGLRFFAHDARPDDCASKGEGPEHRELKRRIAGAIRDAGGSALIEAQPTPTDRGGWRADVLAVAPSGRRVAFEVQLAGMTVDEGTTRTQRYAADGIATVWVSTKHTHWMSRLPSMHLVPGEGGQLLADRGLARLGRHAPTSLSSAGTVDAKKVIRGLLEGRITTAHTTWMTEQAGDRSFFIDAATLLVSTDDARRYGAAIAAEEARLRREVEAEERHRLHVQALLERQERVLQSAVRDAVQAGVPDHRIWLGVPTRWWNGQYPVPLPEASGNPKTAMGAPIWTGPSAEQLSLWAVVCPVASRASASLGRSWAHRGVRVYVESEAEATWVSQALAWNRSGVRIISSTTT